MVPVFFYQFFLLCLIFKYGNSVKNSNCETLPSGEVVCEDTEQRQEEEKKSSKLKDICTIPRIHRSQMTPELFRSSYYLKQPVIVTNVVSSPSAKGWTTEDLLSKYDEVPVGTGSSRTITKMGGTGRASAKLGDIIRALRTNNIHHGDVDVYAFDRDSQLFQHAPQLINDVRNTASDVLGSIFAAPKLPSKVKFNTTAEKPIYRYFLSVGGKGSGVHLHHHSDGWSYLFEGEKRWFVRSPYTLPRITHMGFMRMRYWLSDGVYPKLTFGKKTNDQQMLECVQYPGDLIYVPESWWHGTINEGKPITLSVAAQLVDPVTEFERMMLSASLDKNSGKNNRAFKTLQTLVKKIPVSCMLVVFFLFLIIIH
jgi:oxalate decarboxylase/phosphoglucose isomerase-like protein (cupin superfamily)